MILALWPVWFVASEKGRRVWEFGRELLNTYTMAFATISYSKEHPAIWNPVQRIWKTLTNLHRYLWQSYYSCKLRNIFYLGANWWWLELHELLQWMFPWWQLMMAATAWVTAMNALLVATDDGCNCMSYYNECSLGSNWWWLHLHDNRFNSQVIAVLKFCNTNLCHLLLIKKTKHQAPNVLNRYFNVTPTT